MSIHCFCYAIWSIYGIHRYVSLLLLLYNYVSLIFDHHVVVLLKICRLLSLWLLVPPPRPAIGRTMFSLALAERMSAKHSSATFSGSLSGIRSLLSKTTRWREASKSPRSLYKPSEIRGSPWLCSPKTTHLRAGV